MTASNFSSSQVLIPPAMKTGNLTLITGAMAREILVGPTGKRRRFLHRQSYKIRAASPRHERWWLRQVPANLRACC